MSLYVRLQTSFFTHRKTARLLSKLGTDAYWLPPRIWAYAAEHQPDGDFSKYEPEELAMLVGYNKDASTMLEALNAAGFFDGMQIHQWDEHNSYHAVFSERAKKAATARWTGKDKKGNQTGKERKESKHDSSMLVALDFAESIYSAYPRKIGKPAALKAIRAALKKQTADILLAATKQYASAIVGTDEQFIPYPATWFNQERYNDDPKTWAPARNGANGFHLPSKRSETRLSDAELDALPVSQA